MLTKRNNYKLKRAKTPDRHCFQIEPIIVKEEYRMTHLTYSYIHRRAIHRDQRQATGLKNIYFLKYTLIIFNI